MKKLILTMTMAMLPILLLSACSSDDDSGGTCIYSCAGGGGGEQHAGDGGECEGVCNAQCGQSGRSCGSYSFTPD